MVAHTCLPVAGRFNSFAVMKKLSKTHPKPRMGLKVINHVRSAWMKEILNNHSTPNGVELN
jgi:hypothetical protein